MAAQFTTAIHLSASMSDAEFDLRLATFGSWVTLSERLAATSRRLLQGDYRDAAQCCQLYKANDTSPVEAITSADLSQILHQALGCRNTWLGHGGVSGPRVHRQRLEIVADLLARVRGQIGGYFRDWILFRPGPATYSRAVFNLTATILQGANPTFRRKEVRLTHPADTEQLYLLHDGQMEALELVPLIRIMPGPNTGVDACYFYNRLDGSKVRWISYHFHAEPEVVQPDDDVLRLMATVRGRSQPGQLECGQA